MKSIVIGKSGGKPVSIDLETLLRTRLLAQANSGGGKSWLLRVLAEQLFGKVQVIIIDREGEFASLREKYGYVLIGEGGDAAADLRSARIVAEKLLELNASAVIDLYEAFRKRPLDRLAYVGEFLDALIDAPKKLWRDLVIITDEAHQFCPQENPKMATMVERAIIAKCKNAMIAVATVGRKRGYCAIWVTQRLAKLDKDASAELMNRLVGMTFEDVDVDRSADLMSVLRAEKPAFKKSLKNLNPGHFYGFGRAISKERILLKIGPVKTTHPEPGSAKHALGPPPAPEKIRLLLPKLKDLPQAAEEKAKTEKELRLEIRTLKVQLSQKPKAAVPAPVPRAPAPRPTQVTVKVPILKDGQVSRLEKAIRKLGDVGKAVEAVSSDLLTALRKAQERPKALPAPPLRPAPPRPPPAITRVAHAASRQAARMVDSSDNGNGDVTPPQRKILTSMAEFEALGRMQLPKTSIAAFSGVSHKSSGYKNNLSSLRTKRYLEYTPGKTLGLTPEGRELIGPVVPPATPEEAHERCRAVLTEPQRKILSEVFHRYPEVLTREELAEQVGVSPNSSGYKNNLSALRSAGMIEYKPEGIKCSGWIYLEEA